MSKYFQPKNALSSRSVFSKKSSSSTINSKNKELHFSSNNEKEKENENENKGKKRFSKIMDYISPNKNVNKVQGNNQSNQVNLIQGNNQETQLLKRKSHHNISSSKNYLEAYDIIPEEHIIPAKKKSGFQKNIGMKFLDRITEEEINPLSKTSTIKMNMKQNELQLVPEERSHYNDTANNSFNYNDTVKERSYKFSTIYKDNKDKKDNNNDNNISNFQCSIQHKHYSPSTNSLSSVSISQKSSDVITENKEEVEKIQRIRFFNRQKRINLFILFTFITILTNFDDGCIPAATVEIKEYVNINDDLIGLLGTLTYAGNLVGAIATMFVINRFNSRKWLLVGSLFGNCVFQGTFYSYQNYIYMAINRIFNGCMQSFIMNYSPIWIDQFAPRNLKTLFMSIFFASVLFGVVCGYTLTFFIKTSLGWGYSFVIQGFLILSVAIATTLMEDTFFSAHISLANPEDNLEATDEQQIQDEVDAEIKKTMQFNFIRNETDKELVNMNTDPADYKPELKKEQSEQEIKDEKKKESETPDGAYEKDEESIFYDAIDEEELEDASFVKHFKEICQHKNFVILAFSGTVFMFTDVAVAFWMSDYFREIFKVDEEMIFLTFSIIRFTAPTLGMIISGIIVQKYGGYEGKHSILFVFCFAAVECVLGILLTTFDSLEIFAPILWLVSFLFGCKFPILVGIMVATLPDNLKAPGMALYSVMDNAFGFFCAPYVYGAIYEASKTTNPRLAMSFVYYYTIIGVILILAGMIIRYKDFKIKELEKNQSVKEYIRRKTDPRITIPTIESARMFIETLETDQNQYKE